MSISSTITTPSNNAKHRPAEPSSSFSSFSTSSNQTVTTTESQLFPLPSLCLYSQKALISEFAPESEIVQFLAPLSSVLQERLPMFVGVLQSLFTVVNDLPFAEPPREEEIPAEEEDEYTDFEDEREQTSQGSSSPFTIVGLSSMKLVIWNNMCNHVTDSTSYENDLCLVIFVSAHFTDAAILKNMQLLKKSLLNESICTSFEVKYSPY
ncbi:hypothetical protein BD408DRAFT_417034 [Parasitella parasitica]|nr:hypothetical protein BD408DRAFT_417034 [Parasitella parasitica]